MSETLPALKDASLSKKRMKLFLHFLGETGGRVRAAAQLAGFADASTLYRRRKEDKQFAQEWAEAIQIAGDNLEDEAVRRAKEGVEKDVYYKGEVCGTERVYSDGLMSKLLDGAKPEKYAPKKDGISSVNVHVGVAVIPMTAPREDDWERGSIALQNQRNHENIIDSTAVEVQKKLPVSGMSSTQAKVVHV